LDPEYTFYSIAYLRPSKGGNSKNFKIVFSCAENASHCGAEWTIFEHYFQPKRSFNCYEGKLYNCERKSSSWKKPYNSNQLYCTLILHLPAICVTENLLAAKRFIFCHFALISARISLQCAFLSLSHYFTIFFYKQISVSL
jgi:hypothetical protein